MGDLSDNFYNRVRNLLPSFTGSYAKIAWFFLDNAENLKFMRIKNIAEKCLVSDATVTRFIKELGFKSFYDFKMTIAHFKNNAVQIIPDSTDNFVYADISPKDTLYDIIAKVKSDFIDTIDVTMEHLDVHELEKAVNIVKKAKKINLYAVGNSSVAAKHAYLRFYRVGKDGHVYTDPAEMAVSATLLGKDDVAIGLSYSGKSEPVVKAISYAKEKGCPTIGITGPAVSPLIKMANIKLTTVKPELDDFQLSSFSRLSQILILDLIYAGSTALNFEASAGAIKKSATCVRDILHN